MSMSDHSMELALADLTLTVQTQAQQIRLLRAERTVLQSRVEALEADLRHAAKAHRASLRRQRERLTVGR